MRTNAKISPTRLPAFSPVRLGHHRHFATVMPRLRASLVLRRIGSANSDGLSVSGITFVDIRRPADARHAA
ncbi:MAG TPA: hypothetical protein VGD88_07820 [Opitutaceae bacterium]